MCLLFAGFVPGTTAVRKAHQIPVDSLVDYLQKELGLHQGGNKKSTVHFFLFEHCMIMSLENCFICLVINLRNLFNHLIITTSQENASVIQYYCVFSTPLLT